MLNFQLKLKSWMRGSETLMTMTAAPVRFQWRKSSTPTVMMPWSLTWHATIVSVPIISSSVSTGCGHVVNSRLTNPSEWRCQVLHTSPFEDCVSTRSDSRRRGQSIDHLETSTSHNQEHELREDQNWEDCGETSRRRASRRFGLKGIWEVKV